MLVSGFLALSPVRLEKSGISSATSRTVALTSCIFCKAYVPPWNYVTSFGFGKSPTFVLAFKLYRYKVTDKRKEALYPIPLLIQI